MKQILMALMLVSSIALIAQTVITTTEASPYFTTPTKNKIVGIIKSDSDCWHEYYARATPKNNNGILLNKETIKNNDAPDAGPSETHQFVWYYDYNKMIQTASTNEGRIRTYVTIELTDEITGETVTHYKSVTAGTARLDMGIFYMHTNKALCQ
ncbi:MAG TPA: hypothetical protein VF220_05405 [Nitrososphaeraceae archaeon]